MSLANLSRSVAQGHKQFFGFFLRDTVVVCCVKAAKINVKVSDSLKIMFIKDKLYGLCGVVNEAVFADCFMGKKTL